MSSSFGTLFRATTFGESHGPAVGVVVDGCPSLLPIDVSEIQCELDRRRPGQSRLVTQRKESDTVEVLSGLLDGVTLGTPIAMLVRNEDARSRDYDEMRTKYRPSHADFTYTAKFGFRDHRGGGRSSARETIGRVAAGAIARKILKLAGGVEVRAFVTQVHDIVAPELVKFPTLAQVEAMVVVGEALERAYGLPERAVRFEVQIETPQIVLGRDGRVPLAQLAAAGDGRVTSLHFGTYDYTAAIGISARHQSLEHPAADLAKDLMQLAVAGTGIRLSDGSTNILPVGDGALDAWVLHARLVRRALERGIFQGWDLHPAQFPTRYAAVYAFFLEGLNQAGSRLSNFVESAAKATLVGEVFDDAATGQGLLNYFLRAINCGAIDEHEATSRTGLSVEEIQTRSFLAILDGRT